MKRFAFFVCAAVLWLPAHSLSAEADPAQAAQQATAGDLIQSAQRAVGQVVRVARNDSTLPVDSADAKPFWEAMKTANQALEKADTGLTLKDDTFFTNLAEAYAAVQQADIGLTMADNNNAAIAEGMQTLAGVMDKLNDNYSREALRAREGGELTEAERQQLDKLKARQKELERKLNEVESKAGKNSEEIKKGTEKIKDNSRRISSARYTPGDFFGAMMAARMMSGLIWGWHWWWGPWGWWGPDFININIDIWVDWTDMVDVDWLAMDDLVDVGDLELDALDIDDAELGQMDDFLDDSSFDIDDADMMEMTEDLDVGWDEVPADLGAEAMDVYEGNFDEPVFEAEPQFESFDAGGFDRMDDMGSDFGDFDFGGDFDF